MSRDTHELWSWDASNRAWIALDSGTSADMLASRERRLKSARKFGIDDAAYVVLRRGQKPQGPPPDTG